MKAALTLRIPIEQRHEFEEIYTIYQRAFELVFKAQLSLKSLKQIFPEIHSALLDNARMDERQFFNAVRKNKAWPKELPQPSILLRPKHIKFDDEYRTATIIYKPRQPLMFRIYPTNHQKQLLRQHKFSGARLVKRDDDKFALHLYIKIPIKFHRADAIMPRYVAGIDVGEHKLAAVAIFQINTNDLVVVKTWKGGLYRHLTKKMRQTTSESKRYQSLDDKRKQMLHNITTEVAKFIAGYDSIVVAMEKLETLRPPKAYSATQRWLRHNFPKRRIQRLIEYKTRLRGIPTLYVNAYKTSQLCGRCDSEGERNRARFKCPHCDYQQNSDVNASINIARRAIAERFSDSCSL